MTSTTILTIDPALKQIYKPDNYRVSTLRKRPMLALMPKTEDFGGRNQPLVNEYGNPQGVSSDFPTAQAQATPMQLGAFLLTRVSLHGVATLDSEAIEATDGDKYAFIKAMSEKIDAQLKAVSDVMESYIPRGGTGLLATISAASNVATATITLTNIADIFSFEVGMAVQASQTEGGALRTGGASEVIKGVNRSLGQLTSTSATWATVITAIAASDGLYRKGDSMNGGSARRVFTGWQGWLPNVTPTPGESFFGVDRSVDSRLYGNYYDGSQLTIKEAANNSQSIGASMGAMIDTCFMHHTKLRRLKTEISDKEWYPKTARGPEGEIASLSFQALRQMGDEGPIDYVAANRCPAQEAFQLELDTWVLATLGAAPRLNMIDGNQVLRQASNDGVEVRVVGRGNVGCKNPIANVRTLLAA